MLTQWVFITLDGEDIMSESLDSSTDLVHRESVCSEVNPAGVLWEDEVHSTSEHTVLHSPITQRISLVEGEIVIKITQFKVKCILVGLSVLADVVHEVSTPFRVLIYKNKKTNCVSNCQINTSLNHLPFTLMFSLRNSLTSLSDQVLKLI